MASGFALDNYFFQTDSTIKFYNPPGTSYTLVGVNIDGESIVVNSEGKLQAIAAVAETTYPLTVVSGKYSLLYDNATLTLNSSNQLSLNLANTNTWTATQIFKAPGGGGNVFQFEVGNLGGVKQGLAYLNYYELPGLPTYLMALSFIINNYNGLSPVTVLTMNGNGNGSLQSAKNTLDDGSGNMNIAGAINPDIAQTTITGTTSGSLVASMPMQGSSYKKVIVYANGYENDTTTAQTYTFPVAFTNTPVITVNSANIPGVTVSTTSLSIDPNNTTAYTGWIIIEGY